MNKITWTRDYFIPKNEPTLKAIERPDIEAVVYTYETKDVPYALGFKGKAQKPAFHYRFQDENRRTRYVAEFFDGIRAHKKLVTDFREKRKSDLDGLKVGDILWNSWGYDQTNIDFYQVVSRTAKTVTVREICQNSTETGFMCGNCTPIKNRFVKDSKPKILHSAKYTPWDGRPKHYSSYR